MCYLILVDHLSLFHLLNCDYLLGLFVSANSNFSESTTANNLKRVEISDCNFGTRKSKKFCLFMLDLLLNQLLLFSGQVHFVHLLQKFIPSYHLINYVHTYPPSSLFLRSLAWHTCVQCKLSRPRPSP